MGSWEGFRGLLGAIWEGLGGLGSGLGALRWSPGVLERSWGRLGAILRPSWVHLGAVLGEPWGSNCDSDGGAFGVSL